MLKLHQDLHPEQRPKFPFLKSFTELANWQPGNDDRNVARVTLRTRPEFRQIVSDEEKSKRDLKVIACHDMAGGYIEDYFKIGYSIQYWQYVDTFIYFSHNRIGVPPPQWTNAAHRNGVKVLGTLITEWQEAMLENDLWVRGPNLEGKLSEVENVDRSIVNTVFADKLIQMAEYYNFDGWFINVEAPLVGGAAHAKQLMTFLEYLKREIHRKIPGSLVIWYDSVTTEGLVQWQDRLDDANYPFFKSTDGIFVNYTWQAHFPALSAARAGEIRQREVYTGIDIWGRNTYGGGGFSTHKALEIIKNARTSAALFAPAWTFEHLGVENFWDNDKLFWQGGVSSQSTGGDNNTGDIGITGVRNPGIADYVTARYPPDNRLFYTNFSRGCGKNFYVDGRLVLSNQDWYHLSHQSIQPNKLAPTSPVTFDYSFDKAYQGGTSLIVTRTAEFNSTRFILSLYEMDVRLSTNGPTRITVTYLPAHNDVHIGTFAKLGANGVVEFVGGNDNNVSSDGSDGKTTVMFLSFENSVIQSGTSLPPNQVKMFKPTSSLNRDGWITSEFLLEPNFFLPPPLENPLSIKEFGLTIFTSPTTNDNVTSKSEILAYIGELSITPFIKETSPQEVVHNVFWDPQHVDKIKDQGLLRIWGNVKWEMGIRVNDDESFDNTLTGPYVNTYAYYYVYAGLSTDPNAKPVMNELTFLGIADTNSFWIAGFDVSADKVKNENAGLVVWIQSVKEEDGAKAEVFEWRKCWIKLTGYID
ncbi:3848_t:CDS:2 [Ambispora leptoticha]|uniref:3848_t:CDS:1 n=1 Tax=Ambispora leptoticha TaxID=144679 RepID=A0A9N9F904_9GLOM|nr:3848_t:CDS:2 [Ambispora leptoticha]